MPSPSRKKLLLMGRSGSGKSSMRSIIFSNYSAFDTRRLGATIDVEHSQVRFLGNMTLNLWDCGGQDAFMDSYYTNQRDHIFRMVEVLIHVFDVESEEVSKDIETFARSLKSLKYYSPDAKVFCLLHKMDLVQAEKRQEVFTSMAKTLDDTAKPFNIHITAFATSIWDESLYKAWSSIVCSLIPNMTVYQKGLGAFAEISDAEEVILFEKTTFLVVSHVSSNGGQNQQQQQQQDGGVSDLDPKRFEKISNIIKTYKQSCSKMRAHLQSMYLQGAGSSTYIDTLTANTYIMVVVPSSLYKTTQEEDALMVQNIKFARKWFEKTNLI